MSPSQKTSYYIKITIIKFLASSMIHREPNQKCGLSINFCTRPPCSRLKVFLNFKFSGDWRFSKFFKNFEIFFFRRNHSPVQLYWPNFFIRFTTQTFLFCMELRTNLFDEWNERCVHRIHVDCGNEVPSTKTYEIWSWFWKSRFKINGKMTPVTRFQLEMVTDIQTHFVWSTCLSKEGG